MKFLVPESAPKYKRKWGRVCESHLEALDSGERNRFSPSAPAGLPKIALPASASAPCTSNSFLGPQALHQGWPTQYHLHRSFFSDFLYPTWVPPPRFVNRLPSARFWIQTFRETFWSTWFLSASSRYGNATAFVKLSHPCGVFMVHSQRLCGAHKSPDDSTRLSALLSFESSSIYVIVLCSFCLLNE